MSYNDVAIVNACSHQFLQSVQHTYEIYLSTYLNKRQDIIFYQ